MKQMKILVTELPAYSWQCPFSRFDGMANEYICTIDKDQNCNIDSFHTIDECLGLKEKE